MIAFVWLLTVSNTRPALLRDTALEMEGEALEVSVVPGEYQGEGKKEDNWPKFSRGPPRHSKVFGN